MDISLEHLDNGRSPEGEKWVLLMYGADEAGVTHHGAGVTVKSTAQALEPQGVDLATEHARKLGLNMVYVMGG